MLFSDPSFFAFFAIYFSLHLITPLGWRLYLLIAGSAVFYAWWRPEFVWLPFVLSLIAWWGTIWIASSSKEGTRKRRLLGVLVVLFAPLVIFKYTHFFLSDVIGLFAPTQFHNAWQERFKFALPLGISFVTFTLAAYVVDVFRGKFHVERRFSLILGYVLFFPHLIAGPILRPHELIPQLLDVRRALGAQFTMGAAIFALGLSKKLIFADTLAPLVDRVFVGNAQISALDFLLAIYAFSVQIYCDFSGYTDMAIGLAYLLRVRLPQNFITPYGSHSVIEFWRSWHITLSHWLRDYLYIPLGGREAGFSRQLANLMITMLLGGLWHGANWTFVVWGGLHGLALVINHIWRKWFARVLIPKWLGVVLTFNFVTFAWVFFRAPDWQSAIRVLAGVFSGRLPEQSSFINENYFAITLIAFFLAAHRFDNHARIRLALRVYGKAVAWPFILGLAVLSIALSQGSSAKFIYFDF
jgi:alginate O-acetyltransferase complex protein AlgI